MSRDLPVKLRGEVSQCVELPRSNKVWERGSERNSVGQKCQTEVGSDGRQAWDATQVGLDSVPGIVRSREGFPLGGDMARVTRWKDPQVAVWRMS